MHLACIIGGKSVSLYCFQVKMHLEWTQSSGVLFSPMGIERKDLSSEPVSLVVDRQVNLLLHFRLNLKSIGRSVRWASIVLHCMQPDFPAHVKLWSR